VRPSFKYLTFADKEIRIWLAAREGDDRVARYLCGYADQPDDALEVRAMVDV
jgi:hypothetical protein